MSEKMTMHLELYIRIVENIEALGLRTSGKELENPSAVVKPSIFTYAPVNELYRIKIPALCVRLLHDEGTTLDRDDPNLFDAELNEILQLLGPKIWPKPSSGSRDHLRKPEEGSRYPLELVYPRDRLKLKKHIRNIVLAKHAQVKSDLEARNQKKVERPTTTSPLPARYATRIRAVSTDSTTTLPASQPEKVFLADTTSDPETPVHRTHRRGKIPKSNNPPFRTELHLYRSTTLTYDQVYSPGAIILDSDCTANECFSMVCKQMKSDCSWLTFYFPEDMAPSAKIRIDRGRRESEEDFQHVLEIFRNAPKFPGDITRIVEVECGLDLEF